MSRPIVWRAEARVALLELYDWISRRADPDTALGYTAAIQQHVDKLGDLPNWGSPRDDLAPGVRTISYRRRTTIAYQPFDDRIEIIHLAHGGRDLGRDFVAAED